MAELILSPIAKKVIEELGSAAVKEIGLLWGVNDELERLQTTVSVIKGVLLDAEEKQHRSRGIRLWLESLEDVFYDADDLLDEFNTEALIRQATPKKVCTFFSSSNQAAFRLKMGHKMRGIRERLDQIGENRRNFLLEVRHEHEQVVAREQTHSFVLEEEVVGREKDKMAILERLLEAKLDEDVSVISIVGMGGLGKTTLAQSVFNDETVQQHFELKMWVCVLEEFDLKVIVRKIITSATNKIPEDLEIDQLQNELRKQIDGKRYLLVLDDMWEENREKWLKLRTLLISGAEGSRIIVTTRSKIVAEITESAQPYLLGILDEEKSWLLFKKLAFKRGQEQNESTIAEIGMKIVKKCGGIPLAIRTIGSMLFLRDPKTEWSPFNEKEFSEISQNGSLLPTLELSYEQLTSPLKHCFAFCSLFPKGYDFDKEILIDHWMAQGFLMSSNSSCPEDVGNEYFSHLLWRSFFQEGQKDERNNEVKYKMHDLMHDLAVSVAKTKSAALGSNEEKIDTRTHHVSFASAEQIPASLIQARRIRTILLPRQDELVIENVKKLNRDAIISNFKCLRTLDLHISNIKRLSKSIGTLKHLRYLDLSRNYEIKALPNSVSKLQNLRTLKLNCCESLQELPKGIKKLVNLKRLEISACHELKHMPRGLGQLTNLRTLTKYELGENTNCFSGNCGELNELMGLNNLRGTLEITIRRHGKDAATESRAANLKEKQHLDMLKLQWNICEDKYYGGNIGATEAVDKEIFLEGLQPHPSLKQLHLSFYRGMRFPSWLSSLTNLVTLELENCTNCQHLPPLDKLNSLRILKLYELPALEYISDHGVDDFSGSSTILLPSLEELSLVRLPELKGWWRDVDTCQDDHPHTLPSFPRLSKLNIRYCPQLTCMPFYPHVKRSLYLINTSLKPFQQTMMMKISVVPSNFKASDPSTSSTSIPTSCSYPLSQLRHLWISQNDELQCLPDWLRNLTSLEVLDIRGWTKLKSVSPGIQHLVSLRSLIISGCSEEFDMRNDDPITLQSLQSLRSLTFGFSPTSVVLPEKIQYITSLQELFIAGCPNLMVIPDWIENLKSLKELRIDRCYQVESLPEGIQGLTSLKTLRIIHCPILLPRCRSQTGQDWPKIAHIPNLDLYPNPNTDDTETKQNKRC